MNNPSTENKGKKVVVGMSGGVDSAVVAAILKDEGYEVIGLFMKNWDDTDEETGHCTATQDYDDAKAVAKELNIPIHQINFEKEYWNLVFENFIAEYSAGRTPNPDILCNKEIKFKAFLNYALEKYQPDFIATGHYAQIKELDGVKYIAKGIDNNKDQSYFLGQVNPVVLDKVLFPLGKYEKSYTRELALKYNLPNAKKKDSTGICFIGKNTNFREFLANFIPAKSGEMVDINGNIKGTHSGIMYYTLGQRKGLSIGGEGSAWYVVGKNIKKNQLIVDQDDSSKLLKSTSLLAVNTNNYSSYEENEWQNGTAKFRYRQSDINVKFRFLNNKLEVVYEDGYFAVTPGQQVVVYVNDNVVAAGEIDEIFNAGEKLTWV